MVRFFNEPAEFVDLAACSDSRRAHKKPNSAIWEILLQLFDHRHNRIILIAHAEEDFILWIVQPAEAREILVGFAI